MPNYDATMPLIFLAIISIYWILVCISFIKKYKFKNFLFSIKKTNKKFTFAMSLIYFFSPFYMFISRLHIYLRDIQLDHKLDSINPSFFEKNNLHIEHYATKSKFESIVFLGILILIYLITYYIYNFTGYKIYENGISNTIFTTTWNEIVECVVKENSIYLKFKYKLFFFNPIITHNIKLKNKYELISILKKYNVNIK